MALDNMTWYARIGVFQLTKFKSAPSHSLESTLNTPIFTLSIWVLFFTYCNFIINLGLSIYDILSLLTCFFGTKPSWITSPELITMFLLFIHISYGGQLREGLIQLLIVCSGDIEVNPGPKIKSQLSFCHWNLNGLSAHNFVKVSVLQARVVTHDHDTVCLSETFLDSSISNNDERNRIEGYNLLREDHPNNKKREVFVCIIKNIFLL